MSKYVVFSGPYFLVFELNTGKYGPEKAPYLDIFCVVVDHWGQESNTAILYSSRPIRLQIFCTLATKTVIVLQWYSHTVIAN